MIVCHLKKKNFCLKQVNNRIYFMKKLSWINKIMFVVNIVLAILTFVAYVLPFLAPKLFPILSALTLILPLFLILNGLFFVYWGIQVKRQILLPALVLLMGITFINKFYKVFYFCFWEICTYKTPWK